MRCGWHVVVTCVFSVQPSNPMFVGSSNPNLVPLFFNVKSFFCGLHYRAQNRGRRDCTPPCRTGPGLEASLGRKKEAESEHVFVENLDLQILTQSCHYMFGVRMSGCGARNVRMRQRGCWTACGTCGFVLFGLVLSSDIVIPV